MKRIKIKGVNEELFYAKLRNGLRIYLMPDLKSKSFYISYVTKYGGVYNDFKLGIKNKYYNLPNGVAHFLEHLMFKDANGNEVSSEFAKYGSHSNAYTSNAETCYYVVGPKKFKENLELLLDFVSEPYFTKENVEKERNIIIEEIKMGDDNHYKDLNVKALKNVFFYSKRKEPIAGTIDDVKRISLDDINFAYHTFYHPKNMFVVITGNFDKDEALKIISDNQTKKSFPRFRKINFKKVKEPLKVKKSYDEISKNIEIAKTAIRLKLSYHTFKYLKEPKLDFYFQLLIDAKFGSTSAFNEELVNKGLIIGSLYSSASIGKSGILLTIIFESKNPLKVIPLIKKELRKLKITEEELERKKKCLISNTILYYDKVPNKNDIIVNNIIDHNKVMTNYYGIIKRLNMREFNKLIKKIYFKNNIAVMVIKPMKKSAK
jgi:predicted Zn-dependent peptidase